MRKQVQKERCTKIMLTKCKAVCCLYDKVQLAAVKMLDAEPAIFQFECNVPILCNDIPANDLNLPSETYTTDFVLHYDDGHTAVREAVFRSYVVDSTALFYSIANSIIIGLPLSFDLQISIISFRRIQKF